MSRNLLLTTCATMPQRIPSLFIILFLLSPVITRAQMTDTLLAARDNTLATRLGLHADGSFYLLGNFGGGAVNSIPVEGPGSRMLWYPAKAAFRAGYIDNNQWDEALIGLHSLAIGENTRANGDNSVALGRYCLASGISTFAVGDQNTASGAASVALGYHAHTNARQGSFVFADRSTIDTLRAGVNHSASWRLSGGFRIFTASNLSTGVTFQSGASVSNWGQASAVISTSTGAMLTTGGVWQNASDVNRKHLFEPVSGEDILLKLRQLPIQKWSYRTENDQVRHIGPTAQDFFATFQLGNDERGIGTVDADGIALAAVQALEKRTQEQTSDIANLRAENEILRKRLEALEDHTAKNNASLPWIMILATAGIIAGSLIVRSRRPKTAH